MKKFSKKLQNTIRLAIIFPKFLDNLTCYLIETIMKPTETSKKIMVFLEKNCKKFKFLEKIAKFEVFGKNLQNLINLVAFFVASDLVETIYVRTEFEIEFKLYFERHHNETMIRKRK